MQSRIEDGREDHRIMRFVRASFQEGDSEGRMQLVKARRNHATRETAPHNDIIEVVCDESHDGGQ
jgi:hypothetical protein